VAFISIKQIAKWRLCDRTGPYAIERGDRVATIGCSNGKDPRYCRSASITSTIISAPQTSKLVAL